ncbi:30S ribosomal protein S5 [Nanoarchaeota archaeon]
MTESQQESNEVVQPETEKVEGAENISSVKEAKETEAEKAEKLSDDNEKETGKAETGKALDDSKENKAESEEKQSEKKQSEKKQSEKKQSEEKREKPKRSGSKGEKGFKRRQQRPQQRSSEEILAVWKPKTEMGKLVKSGELTDIEDILDVGKKILEIEVVELLLPNIETELLMIGQSKGKFGGGARRIFKQTQKKTREGNKPSFATCAAVGNKDGIVGIGYGKSKETVPAREKAIRKAKLNIIKIRRGAGSWESKTTEPTSIPFKVSGREGSVSITLIPAPKGTGLKVEKECQKILSLAGIKDVWSKTSGQSRTKTNLVKACFEALKQLSSTKVKEDHYSTLGIVEGKLKASDIESSRDEMKELAEGESPVSAEEPKKD